MAIITIEYDEGTVAVWTMPDYDVEVNVEPILGNPDSIKC